MIGLAWIPNGLSLARLVMGLAFPLVPEPWRLTVMVLAALSDALDGAAGRWLRAETELGRLLDPVADKIFLLGVLLTLLWEGTLTPEEMLLVGLRDLVIGLAGIFALVVSRGRGAARMRPTLLGKATTLAQLAFVLVVLIQGQSSRALMILAAVLGILATIDYLRRYVAGQHQES